MNMRATHGLIAIAVVGAAACGVASDVEPRAAAQVSEQAQADHVTVLKVEGMT
jgi:predicted outer membrane protein